MKVSPILWDGLSRCGMQMPPMKTPRVVAVSEMPSARQMGGQMTPSARPVHTAHVGRLVSHRSLLQENRHKRIVDTIVQ